MSTSCTISRQQFLHLFGTGATALLASACLGSCGSKESDPIPGAVNVDFTLDLTQSSNTALQDPSQGFVYGPNREVIVAKTTAGTYLAVQAPCPHEGTTVYFRQSQSLFICPGHDSFFDLSGQIRQGPSPRALKQYTVTQTGSLLRITG